jgi:hypothetical protein
MSKKIQFLLFTDQGHGGGVEDRPGDETRSKREELGERQNRRKTDQVRGRRPRGRLRERVERQEKEEN